MKGLIKKLLPLAFSAAILFSPVSANAKGAKEETQSKNFSMGIGAGVYVPNGVEMMNAYGPMIGLNLNGNTEYTDTFGIESLTSRLVTDLNLYGGFSKYTSGNEEIVTSHLAVFNSQFIAEILSLRNEYFSLYAGAGFSIINLVESAGGESNFENALGILGGISADIPINEKIKISGRLSSSLAKINLGEENEVDVGGTILSLGVSF